LPGAHLKLGSGITLIKGGYGGSRECHLKPDLLLIYVQDAKEVRLIRLKSHIELFD
jgi:mRNA interferase YafQ